MADIVTVHGQKLENTFLYINNILVPEELAPFAGIEWEYIIEDPELGVNGLQISVEDSAGNKSPTITYSYIYETTRIEAVPIEKNDLLTGNAFASVKSKQNIDFIPVYGIDSETGKSVIVRAFLKVV
jgi:hypothetical protein